MMRPSPVQREFVPPLSPVAPDGFAVVDEPLRAGLPHRIALTAKLAVVVVLPTGVVGVWRDADPSAVVSASDVQLAVVAGHAGELAALATPPLRLLVQDGGTTLAALAPLAGRRRRIGAPLAALELVTLAWTIHAGTVRGPGDHGSRVQLAWRALGGAR